MLVLAHTHTHTDFTPSLTSSIPGNPSKPVPECETTLNFTAVRNDEGPGGIDGANWNS